MPFSELFDNEFKQRNRGHFSAIVRVAFADGKISTEEQEFLDKIASTFELEENLRDKTTIKKSKI